MPKLMHSTSDIAGEGYTAFLTQACGHFTSFSLVWRQSLSRDKNSQAVGQALRQHQLQTRQGSCWPGTQLSGASATIVTYSLNHDSVKVLQKPGSLFSWISPQYPEDLAFYGKDGRCGFASVAHEGLAWILDLKFASVLPDTCGFFVETMAEKYYRMFNYVG